jgi:hypothetical protein
LLRRVPGFKFGKHKEISRLDEALTGNSTAARALSVDMARDPTFAADLQTAGLASKVQEVANMKPEEAARVRWQHSPLNRLARSTRRSLSHAGEVATNPWGISAAALGTYGTTQGVMTGLGFGGVGMAGASYYLPSALAGAFSAPGVALAALLPFAAYTALAAGALGLGYVALNGGLRAVSGSGASRATYHGALAQKRSADAPFDEAKAAAELEKRALQAQKPLAYRQARIARRAELIQQGLTGPLGFVRRLFSGARNGMEMVGRGVRGLVPQPRGGGAPAATRSQQFVLPSGIGSQQLAAQPG